MTALVDQGFISGMNFAVSIILARHLDPAAYGTFAIVYSVYLLAVVVHDALFLEPLAVYASAKSPPDKRIHVGVLLRWHLIVGTSILVIGAILWLSGLPTRSSMGLLQCFSAATVATPCLLTFWLLRRALYLNRSPFAGPAIAVLYCASLLIGLVISIKRGTLGPSTPFTLMAIASCVSAAALSLLIRPTVSPTLNQRSIAAQHWAYGRWALGSQVLTWAPTSALIWAAGAWYGRQEAGELKAILNFTMPVQQVLTALQLVLLPFVVRTFSHSGYRGVKSAVGWLTGLFAFLAVGYWAPLCAEAPKVLHIAYGVTYSQAAAYLPILAIASVASSLAWAPIIGLRATRRPATVLTLYAVMNGTALLFGLPTLRFAGLHGALIVLALSAIASIPVAYLQAMHLFHPAVDDHSLSLRQLSPGS